MIEIIKELPDNVVGIVARGRVANAGHVSLGQLQVMSAIEHCRSAALGGHVERCQDCGHNRISYNSCRNRHCPKCQGAAAKDWLAAREADLLPATSRATPSTIPKSPRRPTTLRQNPDRDETSVADCADQRSTYARR
jgi:hypothetical protein